MFQERRQRFLDAMGPDAAALVLGAGLATRSNDTEYPFRQDSDLWYLTGFEHPDAVALFRTNGGPSFTLFVQPREPEAEIWTGYRPGVEGAVSDYGADEAHPIGDLHRILGDALRGANRLYHQLGRSAEVDARIVAIFEEMRRRSRAGVNPASEIIDPRSLLHEMRLHKSDDELELMRKAATISHEAHGEAAKIAMPGRYEYELEAVLDYTFRRRGGSGPAYTTIVGGGANATVLHYIRNDSVLVEGDLVLIDSGAEFKGYASDVTRTYPVGGRYEGAAADVYDVVLAAQEASLEVCKPGSSLPEVHAASVRKLTEGLVALGLLSGDVDELVANEKYKPYYMHGTSHWLGLDVHDVGTYTQPGDASRVRSLEPGMVFTVEPGLYIGAGETNAPEAFRGIGVRIEDDVAIRSDGHENLNRTIPKRRDDVEAWMRA